MLGSPRLSWIKRVPTFLRRLSWWVIERGFDPLVAHIRAMRADGVQGAAWLPGHALVVSGWFHAELGAQPSVGVGEQGRPGDGVDLDVRSFAFAQRRFGASDARVCHILAIRGLEARKAHLDIRIGGRMFPTPLGRLSKLTRPPCEWAARLGTRRHVGLGGALASFLASATAPAASAELARTEEWSRALCALREVLRVHVDGWDGRKTALRAAHVDALFGLDDRLFLLQGWIRTRVSPLIRISAISPEGTIIDLGERVSWKRRADVNAFFDEEADEGGLVATGLSALVRSPVATLSPQGWILELEDEHGFVWEAPCPEVERDTSRAGHVTQRELDAAAGWDECAPDAVLAPVTRALEERRPAEVAVAALDSWGAVVEDARISLVVDFGDRSDLIEHQLAQLADDRDLDGVEVILVCEGLTREAALRAAMPRLFEIYRVPFRVAVLSASCSSAFAKHSAALVARAPRLAFLDGNVLPDEPGWLGRLSEFLDGHPRVGAVSPAILADDDTLLHAGLDFVGCMNGPGSLQPRFQGKPHDHAPAQIPTPVFAGTEICMLIERARYIEAGGLLEPVGPSLDGAADLGRRLAQLGWESWCVPAVKMVRLDLGVGLHPLARGPYRARRRPVDRSTKGLGEDGAAAPAGRSAPAPENHPRGSE